jgi:hypothetical protein
LICFHTGDKLAKGVDTALDGAHEKALAATPVAEQAHRQRWFQVPGGDEVGEGVGLDRDADEVLLGVDLIRRVGRHVDWLARIVAA